MIFISTLVFPLSPSLQPHNFPFIQVPISPNHQYISLNHNFYSLKFSSSMAAVSRSSSVSLSTVNGRAHNRPGLSHRIAGEVHVIIGPMFAGKTTALLRRIKSEGNSGRNVVMVKSSKDTRYAIDSVVTHDGLKFPCWALPDLTSLQEKLGDDAYQKIDVIGIDEAQFFEDLYDFCCKAADHDGKTVIVAGLDGDYLRRSFGSVLDVVPLADTVTKLTARCDVCGKHAFFTMRKTTDTQTELIGGANLYMPVCRQHYVNGQVLMEATRSILEPSKVQTNSHVEVETVI